MFSNLPLRASPSTSAHLRFNPLFGTLSERFLRREYRKGWTFGERPHRVFCERDLANIAHGNVHPAMPACRARHAGQTTGLTVRP
jgi:hypothetical protein